MNIQIALIILTGVSCVIWIYLLFFNGWFWLAREVLPDVTNEREEWPGVVAVIPARDEAATIGEVVRHHLQTSYRGAFTLIVVDDHSDDGTGNLARKAGEGAPHPLHVVSGRPLPKGWSGKLWAVNNGLEAAKQIAPEAKFVLLTDADIVHAPETLGKLVDKALSEKRVLVSVMAHLDARRIWGSLLMPAFIFFFQKLYPFPMTNKPESRVAGAAGGCMLIDREALDAIGGVQSIRGSLIDDCSLALKLKAPESAKRSIWLGFDKGVVSLRDNRELATIWKMVARTAFTQLGFSTWALIGATLGMVLTYLIAPIAFFTLPFHHSALAFTLGTCAWLFAMLACCPTLLRYRKSPAWALLLPIAASFYMAMTISSALNHWRGQGGAWKGRTYS